MDEAGLDAGALLRAGRWRDAAASFQRGLAEAPDAAALEGLGLCLWWLDDGDGCTAAREAAYRRYREAHDDRSAGRLATALAWDAVLFGHGRAVAEGWFARATQLLAPLPVAAEHGWLAVREAELALAVRQDSDAAAAAAQRAATIGAALGDGDLSIAGSAYAGLAAVTAGRVVEGMARLDAAVVAALAGDVGDLLWIGKICCWLIAACRRTQDLDRAAVWCDRVAELARARGLSPLLTECRIQHAAVEVSRGSWAWADGELTALVAQLAGSRRESRWEAVAELGELRRRQGRLAEAEALADRAEFSTTAVVCRARLRLARGETASAWSLAGGLLERIPRVHRLLRAEVLPTAVAAAVASGRTAGAAALAAELGATAAEVGSDALLAAAASARALLGGPSALADAQEAVRRYVAAGLRYEAAHARVLLADRLADAADAPGARAELAAALAGFAALGAEGDAAAAAERLRHRVAGGLTPRQREVLRLVAAGRTNAQIAAELVVSEHTVHRHVANILTALGVGSRAGAAARAVGEHLV